MIFVTVGGTAIPFDRLMLGVSALDLDDVYVQHGAANLPQGARGVAYLPFPDLMDRIAQASTIVCHAGTGSVLCSLRAGHTPVVVPRLRRFAETVDDHQLELAQRLAADGQVIAVTDVSELRAAVGRAPSKRESSGSTGTGLVHAIRARIQDRRTETGLAARL